jgi:hypothetical protein
MKNRNYLPDDFLAIFENRVRSAGVWCDASTKDKLRHKFIAKNPNSMLAISLCGTIIRSIEKLHENTLSQKCLVCELYDAAGKEVKEKITHRHEVTLSQLDENPNQL